MQGVIAAFENNPHGNEGEAPMTPEELARDLYQERAAICEFDGLQDRAEAEAAAWAEARTIATELTKHPPYPRFCPRG